MTIAVGVVLSLLSSVDGENVQCAIKRCVSGACLVVLYCRDGNCRRPKRLLERAKNNGMRSKKGTHLHLKNPFLTLENRTLTSVIIFFNFLS
jgi:hypothetical protein